MILYEPADEPLVRAGEIDLAGRRVAVRAIPYSGRAQGSPRSFDPVGRRFAAANGGGAVSVGPFDSGRWIESFDRAPRGAALIGPGDAAEAIHGAYAAAARAAADSGRGVYLLDPPMEALPAPEGEVFAVVSVSLSPDDSTEVLSAAAKQRLPAGVLLPLIPGWTAEPDWIDAVIEAACAHGARFVAGIVADKDGAARRAIVEARAQCPDVPDDFFERVHHGDWDGAIGRARRHLAAASARRGLGSIAVRPVGRTEPPANAGAAARLEEQAEAASAEDEHRASLLHAAVRWIDESGRDLAAIAREGNLRKIFPFGEELARQTEDALRGDS